MRGGIQLEELIDSECDLIICHEDLGNSAQG